MTNSLELSKDDLDDLLCIACFDWNELTGEHWKKYFDVTSWFSPEAFCYYLPSIIKVSIEEHQPNFIVVDSIIWALDRSPRTESWDELFLQRWPLLSIDECRSIQEWVFWLSSFSNSNLVDDSLARAVETLELLISHKQG